ncbi:sugar phosphorylase [uncultured Thermanaerothrix sp.]|uniref:sugar phosphorylase n=1 Tax=uncultured Thermanaerothrix sp. TaxID=1195149 RepID=UPI002613C7B7|nr:sugar phosphorylase [uncultured Thermanaerothrix sp.]
MNINPTPLLEHLKFLYGSDTAHRLLPTLVARLQRFHPPTIPTHPLDHQDVILITYGDQFTADGERPLRTLRRFCRHHLKSALSGLHILPFFPYSSDDGFSVIDFYQVNPALGTWDDIQTLASEFILMVDLVLNHTSVQNPWFQGFLKGDPNFSDFYLTASPETDLSAVVRPRALPLLTPFETPQGTLWVWTTFSADQVDLNYKNPQVLLQMVDVLLTYLEHGARIIRLDAVAYVWKEIGTPCIHLPQTHGLVRLFRTIVKQIAPWALLITETNVPHTENLSYFGDGYNEAHLVYNFALPPLMLHTLYSGNAEKMTQWAATALKLPSSEVTFFNFLASHDGIGINPVRGMLSETEIETLITRVQERGGLISYKSNPDGTLSPYELNITYFDALADPNSEELSLRRFLLAHAILMALQGIPGIYVHSLLGSSNWNEGVRLLGYNRAINRQKFSLRTIEERLSHPKSREARVLEGMLALIQARQKSPAFNPYGFQRVLSLSPAVFCLIRQTPEASSIVLCVHNVSAELQNLKVPLASFQLFGTKGLELLSGQVIDLKDPLEVSLPPYGLLWLEIL